MIKFGVSIAIVLALAAPALAEVYTNAAFSLAVDLGTDWKATNAPEPDLVLFHSAPKFGIAAKLKLIRKAEAVNAQTAAKVRMADEERMRTQHPGCHSLKTAVSLVAGDPAVHYGFTFKDEQGIAKVAHCILWSHADGEGFIWLRMHAVYPAAAHTVSHAALSAFLTGFSWTNAPVARKLEPAAPAMPPAPAVDSTVVGALVRPPAQPEPKAPQADDEVNGYLADTRDMSEKDTKALVNSFKSDGDKRTEEQMERARQFFGGGMFTPKDN